MKRRSVCFPDELDALLSEHAHKTQENISDTIRKAVEKHVVSPGNKQSSEAAAQQLLMLEVCFIIKAFADTVDEALVRDALHRARKSAGALGLTALPDTIDGFGGVQ